MNGDDWTMAHAAHDAKFAADMRSGCSGTFRVVDDDGKRPATVVCDGCGATLTVRQATLKGAPPARPTEAMPFAPSIL